VGLSGSQEFPSPFFFYKAARPRRRDHQALLDETVDWRYFVQCVLESLQPPHIIELLILLTWSLEHTWKVGRPAYLHRLGHFDTRDGIHGDEKATVSGQIF
jgi:hypothetical protein